MIEFSISIDAETIKWLVKAVALTVVFVYVFNWFTDLDS